MTKLWKYMIVAALPFSSALAQERGMGSGGIIGRIQAVVERAESADNEVVRVESDLIRTQQVVFRQMQTGYTYTVVALGSNRIEDLDVEVHKQIGDEWVLIKSDDDAQNVAVVSFTPGSTGLYRITIKAYRFKPGFEVGHYGLVVYHT